jgi:hypothetical protein
MECAKAIEGGNLDVADSLLAEIRSLAPKEESISTRKVVKYCAEALARRACLWNSSSIYGSFTLATSMLSIRLHILSFRPVC